MAQGQLPLYYKNSKLVGPVSTKTKWSEYYLLVVTLFGFLMLFAGLLWFVPIIDADDGYTKAYGGFTGTEPSTSDSVGTGSIMSPISLSAGNVTPSSRPIVSLNVTGSSLTSSQKRTASESSHEVAKEELNHDSGTRKSSSESRDATNALRRSKVEQVV